MTFTKKKFELTAYQANILKVLTEKPQTFAEINKITHDPYADKRAAQLVEAGLVARSDISKITHSGKEMRRRRPAWALTAKGVEWKTALNEAEAAKLKEVVSA